MKYFFTLNTMDLQEYYKKNVFNNGKLIDLIENQTENLCQLAIRNDSQAFNYIKSEFLTETIVIEYIRYLKGYITKIDDINEKLYIKLIKEGNIGFDSFNIQTENICLAVLELNARYFIAIKDQTEKICEVAVSKAPKYFTHVKYQTEKICKIALSLWPGAFRYIQNKTRELCIMAVNSDGNNLAYIEEQDEELCILAIKNNYESLLYVKQQTEEIGFHMCQTYFTSFNNFKIDSRIFFSVIEQTEKLCEYAVNHDPMNIKYVKIQTEKICEIALRGWPGAFQYIKNKTRKLCKIALDSRGDNLAYIEHQDEELCILAVQANHDSLIHVKQQTEEICYYACKKHFSSFKLCKFESERIHLTVLKQNGRYINYIKNKKLEYVMIALRTDGYALRYIENQTDLMCLEALKKFPYRDVLNYVKDHSYDFYRQVILINPHLFKFFKNPSAEFCFEVIKEHRSLLNHVTNQSAEFYLKIHKYGINISMIKYNDLLDTINLEPEILKSLCLNSKIYQKIINDYPYLLEYINLNAINILKKSKQILIYLLGKEDWLIYFNKFFENFLEYYEILVINNNIHITDLENQSVVIKYNQFDLDEKLIVHLNIFKQINNDSCGICLNSTMISTKYCSNIHTIGICYICYKKLMNSENPTCCLCRKQLLTIF